MEKLQNFAFPHDVLVLVHYHLLVLLVHYYCLVYLLAHPLLLVLLVHTQLVHGPVQVLADHFLVLRDNS